MSSTQCHGRPWVVIPIKDLVSAKQRLSGVLSPSERRALAQAMVEDMLQRLQGVAGLDGMLLISDDPAAELLAYRYGAQVITESPGSRGLNAAASRAADWLAARGASHMLLLHGDLPCLQAAEISGLLARGLVDDRPRLLLVPDRRDRGTNGLLCTLPAPVPFCYGEHSLAAHQRAGRRKGLRVGVLPVPGLALDVDTPADLRCLAVSSGLGDKTARFLETSQLTTRLGRMRRAADPAGQALDLPITGSNHGS